MATDDFKNELDIFKGLKALSESSFPKRCGNCGRMYATSEQYLKETENVGRDSGLKATYDDEEDKPVLEVYRNCVCGSTLMDFFSDRRDLSERGLKRREIFQKVLDFLAERGIPAQVGREELLKFMKSGESDILAKYGIKGRVAGV
jgi:hypothetical protein